jgi:hypothetical protein
VSASTEVPDHYVGEGNVVFDQKYVHGTRLVAVA